MQISHDAKLPEIIWKFRRACGRSPSIQECQDHLTRNPHFYPTGQPRISIRPLADKDACGEGPRWTERILVYGDDARGCIKLTSGDGEITKVYGAITGVYGTNAHNVAAEQESIIFKGLSDYLADSLTLK